MSLYFVPAGHTAAYRNRLVAPISFYLRKGHLVLTLKLRRIKPKQRKCPTQILTLSSVYIVSKMLGVSNDGIAVSICINSHRRASLTFISPTSFMSYANTLPSCALPRRRVETRNCLACAHKFPYAQRPMLLIRENADRRCQPQPTILFLNPPHS